MIESIDIRATRQEMEAGFVFDAITMDNDCIDGEDTSISHHDKIKNFINKRFNIKVSGDLIFDDLTFATSKQTRVFFKYLPDDPKIRELARKKHEQSYCPNLA